MRWGLVGDDRIARVAQSGLLSRDGQLCRCATRLQDVTTRKAGVGSVGTSNLIERESARCRACSVGNASAALCAQAKCDGLVGERRRSSAECQRGGERDGVVKVARRIASVCELGGSPDSDQLGKNILFTLWDISIVSPNY